jgi:hypothetical protein
MKENSTGLSNRLAQRKLSFASRRSLPAGSAQAPPKITTERQKRLKKLQ